MVLMGEKIMTDKKRMGLLFLELRGEGEEETCIICGKAVELTEQGVVDHLDYYDHAPLWLDDDDEELDRLDPYNRTIH